MYNNPFTPSLSVFYSFYSVLVLAMYANQTAPARALRASHTPAATGASPNILHTTARGVSYIECCQCRAWRQAPRDIAIQLNLLKVPWVCKDNTWNRMESSCSSGPQNESSVGPVALLARSQKILGLLHASQGFEDRGFGVQSLASMDMSSEGPLMQCLSNYMVERGRSSEQRPLQTGSGQISGCDERDRVLRLHSQPNHYCIYYQSGIQEVGEHSQGHLLSQQGPSLYDGTVPKVIDGFEIVGPSKSSLVGVGTIYMHIVTKRRWLQCGTKLMALGLALLADQGYETARLEIHSSGSYDKPVLANTAPYQVAQRFFFNFKQGPPGAAPLTTGTLDASHSLANASKGCWVFQLLRDYIFGKQPRGFLSMRSTCLTEGQNSCLYLISHYQAASRRAQTIHDAVKMQQDFINNVVGSFPKLKYVSLFNPDGVKIQAEAQALPGLTNMHWWIDMLVAYIYKHLHRIEEAKDRLVKLRLEVLSYMEELCIPQNSTNCENRGDTSNSVYQNMLSATLMLQRVLLLESEVLRHQGKGKVEVWLDEQQEIYFSFVCRLTTQLSKPNLSKITANYPTMKADASSLENSQWIEAVHARLVFIQFEFCRDILAQHSGSKSCALSSLQEADRVAKVLESFVCVDGSLRPITEIKNMEFVYMWLQVKYFIADLKIDGVLVPAQEGVPGSTLNSNQVCNYGTCDQELKRLLHYVREYFPKDTFCLANAYRKLGEHQIFHGFLCIDAANKKLRASIRMIGQSAISRMMSKDSKLERLQAGIRNLEKAFQIQCALCNIEPRPWPITSSILRKYPRTPIFSDAEEIRISLLDSEALAHFYEASRTENHAHENTSRQEHNDEASELHVMPNSAGVGYEIKCFTSAEASNAYSSSGCQKPVLLHFQKGPSYPKYQAESSDKPQMMQNQNSVQPVNRIVKRVAIKRDPHMQHFSRKLPSQQTYFYTPLTPLQPLSNAPLRSLPGELLSRTGLEASIELHTSSRKRSLDGGRIVDRPGLEAATKAADNAYRILCNKISLGGSSNSSQHAYQTKMKVRKVAGVETNSGDPDPRLWTPLQLEQNALYGDLSGKEQFDACARWHKAQLEADDSFFICMCQQPTPCHRTDKKTRKPIPLQPPKVLDSKTTLRQCHCVEASCGCRNRNRIFQTKLLTNCIGCRLIKYRWCKERKKALRGLQSFVMINCGWIAKKSSDVPSMMQILVWKQLMVGFGLESSWFCDTWLPEWPNALLESLGDGDLTCGLNNAKHWCRIFFSVKLPPSCIAGDVNRYRLNQN